MSKIELGDKVKDQISGLAGIAYQIADCLHGCRRVHVEPATLGKDGKLQEAYWFDETRLTVVKKGAFKQPPGLSKSAPEVRPGGPPTRVAR